MTIGLKGHRCGGRRRGHESLISPHLRFTIPDLRSHAPHRGNPPSTVLLRPSSVAELLRRRRGRVCGQTPVFKIKNLLQKIKTYSSNPIKGLLMKKIPNFFTGTLMENYWQIREKPPKKPLKNGQKTRDF